MDITCKMFEFRCAPICLIIPASLIVSSPEHTLAHEGCVAESIILFRQGGAFSVYI